MIDHVAHLQSDVDAVLAVLARSDLTEPVPACPGWTVRELVLHLGNVHRWATAIVQSGQVRPEPSDSPIDVPAWFAEGASTLLSVLRAADPVAPCWSFTTDKTNGFWVRRQALETVVHRWDAEHSTGEPNPIDPELAADGVAEVVDLFVPRQIKLGRIPALPMAVELRATDVGGSWQLGDGSPAATLEASAETLLLLLWHRIDPGDPRVRVTGEAEQVLRLALAP